MDYIIIRDAVAYRNGVLTREGNEFYKKAETVCREKKFHRVSCIEELQKELGCRRNEAEEIIELVFQDNSIT